MGNVEICGKKPSQKKSSSIYSSLNQQSEFNFECFPIDIFRSRIIKSKKPPPISQDFVKLDSLMSPFIKTPTCLSISEIDQLTAELTDFDWHAIMALSLSSKSQNELPISHFQVYEYFYFISLNIFNEIITRKGFGSDIKLPIEKLNTFSEQLLKNKNLLAEKNESSENKNKINKRKISLNEESINQTDLLNNSLRSKDNLLRTRVR